MESLISCLEGVNKLIKAIGGDSTLVIISLLVVLITVITFTLRMKSLTEAIKLLTDKVSTPQLNEETSIIIYDALMQCLTDAMIDCLREILVKNHIDVREAQIKINIEKSFRFIVTNQISKLSSFNSVCGNMGKLFKDTLDEPRFLEDVYSVLFAEGGIGQKLNDIQILIHDIIDAVKVRLLEAGVHNNI